jgi:ABC-type multidrug transport system fused ATPase/permease subunit
VVSGWGGHTSPASLWHLFRRFAPYLLGCPWLVTLTALLVLGGPALGGALLWLLKLVVDEVLVAGNLELLFPYAGLYGSLAALRALLEYAQTRLEAGVVERIVRDLRTDLYAHLLRLSPGSLRDRSAGDLIAHLGGDVERLEALIYSAVISVLDDLASVAFYLVFLFALSWKLTLLSLIVVPILVLAAARYAPRVRRAHRVARRRASVWNTIAETTLNAMPLVQALGGEAQERARFAAACDRTRQAELKAVSIQALLSFLIEAAAAIGTLVLVVAGAIEMHRGTLTMGTLAAFIGFIGSLYSPIRGLARTTARFQRAAAGAQRVTLLLDTPSRVRNRPNARPLRQVRGRVEYRDVTFAYPRGPDVLHGIDLRVEEGEAVALVGPSGGGKSSLIQLLARLYDPCSGAVLIDGHDLRDVTLESLRRAIAVVFQDAYLLRTSVAANIAYSCQDASEAQVMEAARAAHAHEFIAPVPAGYARQLGSRGEGLSGGQKQRIALARALIREAPILVLDEATSAVDGQTEELVQETIQRLTGQRTIFVVAHRLASIRNAHRVVVVEQGTIVESGTPEHLLRAPSRCRQLFASQLRLEPSAA